MPSHRSRSRSPVPSSRDKREGSSYDRPSDRSGGSSRRRREGDDDDDSQDDGRRRYEGSSSRRRRDGSRERDIDDRRHRDRRRDRSRDRYDRFDDDRDGGRAERRDREGRRSGARRGSSRSRSPRSPVPDTRLQEKEDEQPSSRNAGRSSKPLPSQDSALASAGVPASSSSKYGGSKKGGKPSRSPSPSAEAIEASKPNFGNSGALAAETNTFKGVVLKYNEPPEARKPNKGWRLYVFKGQEQVDMIMVSRQSAYLFGRDRVVADIPLDHPSASKQHAVLQFRAVQERSEFGEVKTLTKPYIIDLDSANGTTVNNDKIPASRYYELRPNDVVKFAFSTREYVMIVD